MNFVKRAGLSIIHNLRNNILLILLFTILATLILSGLCIQSASSAQCLAIRRELGNAVIIRPADTKEGSIGTLPIDDLTKVAKLNHVESYNFVESANLNAVDFKPNNPEGTGLSADQVSVCGVLGTQNFILFNRGDYVITSGRHLVQADLKTPNAVIDDQLAKANNLKIGSKITLKPDEGASREFTIVGIYKNNNPGSELSSVLVTYEQLMSLSGKAGVDYGMFYLDDPLNIDTFKKDVKNLNLSSIKPDKIDAQDAVYRRLAGSIANMGYISTIMVVGIIIVGAVILSLILVLNLKGRKFEIGVLLSLGEQKAKVILQMTLETLIPVIIAFTISIAAGSLAAQQIGNIMLGSASSQSSSSESQTVMAEFTGKTFQTNNKVNVTVSVTSQQILQLYLAGILLALASTAVPLTIVMRYNPKDIFAQIE